MLSIPGFTGRKMISSTRHFLELVILIRRLLALIINKPAEGRALIRQGIIDQIFFTGVQALSVIIPTALLLGSMLIVISSQFSGPYNLGRMIILLIVREFGPMIVAVVVIVRSSTAVTIELCYMNILKEMDAIEMSGIDPLGLICLPRLVGITSAILCLLIVFNVVSIVGGFLLVWTVTYVPMDDLLNQICKALSFSDILVGIIKALCFGITITAICLHYGFKAEKRITVLPQLTSKAAVECFSFCITINIFVSVLFYL